MSTQTQSGYHEPGEPARVGAGLVESVSLDDSAVYVSGRDGMLSKPGCGQEPESVLFRLPLAGGAREALGEAGQTATGRVTRGRDGRLALATSCDGVLREVRTATETPDGRLYDLRQLDLSQLPDLTAFAWSADGQSLVTARVAGSGAQSPSSVARVDLSGRVTPLFEVPGAVSQIAQLADGTYVVSGLGKVSVRDGSGNVKGTLDGEGFTVGPDRRKLAVWGRSLLLLTSDDPAPVTLATAQGQQSFGPADFAPDGQAVAYATTVPGGGALAIVTLVDRRVSGFSASPGRYVRVFFDSKGRSVVFSQTGTGTAEEPSVLVVRFRP